MKNCNQCGKCCLKYGNRGLVTNPDEVRWWETFRPEIARYVRNGQIWVDPDTGDMLQRCPWLVQEKSHGYSCRIYQDRPDDCRHYPVNIAEMIADECEMLEVRDLADKERAQTRLDNLMIDSRPALKAR